MEIPLIYLNHRDDIYKLAKAKQYEMMAEKIMDARLLFKQLKDVHSRIFTVLFAMFLFYGMSHSFVPENETVYPTDTETLPPLKINRTEREENLTREVTNLTTQGPLDSNHSEGILNLTEISPNGSQQSIDTEYTESTSLGLVDKYVSTEEENSMTDATTVVTETGLDKRYGKFNMLYHVFYSDYNVFGAMFF